MTSLRWRFGFWNALGNMSLRKLFLSPEFVGAILLGTGGGLVLLQITDINDRISVAGDALVLSGALLGIVFAGFALVVGLLSDSYLRWLEETPSGVEGFFASFIVAVGIQVGTLLMALSYRAAAPHLDESVERWVFGVLCFLVVFAALDVVALARDVYAHGVARARGVKIDEIRQRKRGRGTG